jgi:hypothetical protein
MSLRTPVIDDETQEQIELMLTQVLGAVADGSLEPIAAKNGLLSLIAGIDNGNQDEIKTCSTRRANFTSVMAKAN